MDLWCNESSSPIQCPNSSSPTSDSQADGIVALVDPNLLNDSRVLEKLLLTEVRCLPQSPEDVYSSVQREARPHMRHILTTWMLEVCEELNCEAIFPLAVNYVDRFLSITSVSKSQLQLLGAVSLMIASKLKQCRSIHPQDLVYFSDYSYTTSDITEWEMLLLTSLKWDVSAVVSTDFIEHLLVRMHLLSDLIVPSADGFGHISSLIRRFATDVCFLCCREIRFVDQKASVIATAALLTAVRAAVPHLAPVSQIVAKAEEVTGIAAARIESCVAAIADMITSAGTDLKLGLIHAVVPNSGSCKHTIAIPHKSVICNTSPVNATPETPTDVQDILFLKDERTTFLTVTVASHIETYLTREKQMVAEFIIIERGITKLSHLAGEAVHVMQVRLIRLFVRFAGAEAAVLIPGNVQVTVL